MSEVKPADRFELLRSIQGQFDDELDTFPTELHPSIIRSYGHEDFNSPGLLSLVALPYWIGDKLQISQQICRDMAVGNLFLLHCFQSFDFIVDDDRPDTSDRSQTALGNLCLLQVMHHYRPYFLSDVMFWERMEIYWQEWAKSLLWEVEEKGTRRPFAEAHLQQAAHKAAALKICPTGLALLAEQADLIPPYEQAVDLMHSVMQLLDDLLDWREDLLHARYNAFLGLMVLEKRIPPNQPCTPEEISTVISNSDILEQYVGIVHDYSGRARDVIDTLDIKAWSMLVSNLAGHADGVARLLLQQMETYLSTGVLCKV